MYLYMNNHLQKNRHVIIIIDKLNLKNGTKKKESFYVFLMDLKLDGFKNWILLNCAMNYTNNAQQLSSNSRTFSILIKKMENIIDKKTKVRIASIEIIKVYL